MKATLTVDGKSIEVELTEEQVKSIGLISPKLIGWERRASTEKYYYIDERGDVNYHLEHKDVTDESCYYVGNYFSNTKKADKMSKRISLMLRMQRWADEHNIVKIDWNNVEQQKYCIYCRFDNKNDLGIPLYVDYTFSERYPNQIYFSSNRLASQALKEFGDELREILSDYEEGDNDKINQ